MKLWKKLYGTVWLAFFSCVLIPGWMSANIGYPVHVLVGILLLYMTATNTSRLKSLPAPGRLVRISRITMGFAIFQLVSGIALGGILHMAPELPYISAILQGVHVVCALAILAQASSVATAYDMWEEKEF